MAKKRLIRFLKWFFGIIFVLVISISLCLVIFKDDICGVVINEVNKHLKVKVSVGEVDLAFWGSFPNLSIDFNEVFIQDSYKGSTNLDTLLYSKKIRLNVNPLDIWRENYTVKSIEVYPGTLKLKVDEAGLNNYTILKEQKDTLNSTFDFNLKSVAFGKFRFSYVNEATKQEYRTLINKMELVGELSSSVFTTKAKTDIQILAARSGNVNLVKNKPAIFNLAINVNIDSSTVHFPTTDVQIASLPFVFMGDITKRGFKFNLKGKNINIADLANNLSMNGSEDVKRLSGQGVLLFNLDIDGTNDASQAVVIESQFAIKSANLRDPSSGISINKLKLDGVYSNRGGVKKEKLELKNISFQTKGGPFKGNMLLTDFEHPNYVGNTNGTINLEILHALFRIPKIKSVDGKVDLFTDFHVTGSKNSNGQLQYKVQKCNGNLSLKNVNIQLYDDKRVFENINGKIYLRNSEAGIDDVTLKIGKSDFHLDGAFKDVIDYFSGNGTLLANVEVKSKRINIEDLGTDSKADKKLRERQYALPDNIDGSVFLEVGEIKYEKHTFSNVTGNMAINGRTIRFPDISLKNGGANILGSIVIEEKTPEIFSLSSQLISNNINFKGLFKEWNNFNQQVIRSENIDGIAQANLQFEAPFDLRSGVISKAIIAQIEIQIDDGRLKNISTFDKITKSLKSSAIRLVIGKENINSLGAKLKDLKFKRLQNTLFIKDGVLTIPSMSIESSALDIELSGTHTFDNKIDYRFGFDFRDLKKHKSSEFGDIVDDGSGIQIFMRMHGLLSNPTITWDKQSRKEKTKEYNEQEKKDIKSILKSEFGVFKNDTTVKQYIKAPLIKEEIIVEFGPGSETKTPNETKVKKDGKLNNWLRKMKTETEAEKKEEFKIDN